jgi:hypothetical protein
VRIKTLGTSLMGNPRFRIILVLACLLTITFACSSPIQSIPVAESITGTINECADMVELADTPS